jgi:SAM-dependent methyltransferase
LIFGSYSKYYNLLYKDKDYAGDAQYVHQVIQKLCPGAKTILNLGCGTGNHDFELAKIGYEVTGIDMSAEMLAVATDCLTSLNSKGSAISPSFLQGDIRTVRLDTAFDVVISLFHVMSYQTTNDDLQAAFATAKAHLSCGGLFLFDCWYGPAVLSDPPVVRIKRLEDDEIEVLRIAEPLMHYNENVVDVNYQVMILKKATGTVQQLRETHRMRYLFMPEISGYLAEQGFSMVWTEEWGTGKEPGNRTWGVCCAGIVA